jgi:uncharacterized SAM-binding protein YcdF (DUF218 family)
VESTLYSVVKSLIMPPGGLILLFLFGFFLVRGVLGRIFIFVGISVFTLMCVPFVAGKLVAGLEPYPALQPEAVGETGAEGILILGAGRYSWAPEYGGDTVGSQSLQRLRYGAFLHRRTGLPVYITGGSVPADGLPVGRLMARVLEREFGVAAAAVEERSLNTDENAAFSVEMLARDGIGRVLLVTHAWHMPRAVGAFARADIETIPAPTSFAHREGGREPDYRDWLPSAAAFIISYYALHEYLGQAWYQVKAIGGKEFSVVGNPVEPLVHLSHAPLNAWGWRARTAP